MSQVPARAEEITIPADVTPERVPTHIIDYCGKITVNTLFMIMVAVWCNIIIYSSTNVKMPIAAKLGRNTDCLHNTPLINFEQEIGRAVLVLLVKS